MDKIVQFAAAHGFDTIAEMNGAAVIILIPTYDRNTGERGVEFETVSTMAEARVAIGY